MPTWRKKESTNGSDWGSGAFVHARLLILFVCVLWTLLRLRPASAEDRIWSECLQTPRDSGNVFHPIHEELVDTLKGWETSKSQSVRSSTACRRFPTSTVPSSPPSLPSLIRQVSHFRYSPAFSSSLSGMILQNVIKRAIWDKNESTFVAYSSP